MTTIESLTIQTPDPGAAAAFYATAFDLGDALRVARSDAPSSGFRGFALSLVVGQPADADELAGSALAAGATVLKPMTKSFWGYGGVVQAPDGTIWKLATSAKRNTGPATRRIDDIVLLLGVESVKTTKAFYRDHGLVVAKSFGSKYVEFDATGSAIKLALYGRRAAAKDLGVSAEGSGAHRIAINGDAGPFSDPDGFSWEPAVAHSR